MATKSELVRRAPDTAELLKKVTITGDFGKLTESERGDYVLALCAQKGLDPTPRPFEFILARDGKLQIYANKNCADQLSALLTVSIVGVVSEEIRGCWITRITGQIGARLCQNIGATPVQGLQGEAFCNAIKKSFTQALRRLMLSASGLSVPDETELNAEWVKMPVNTGDSELPNNLPDLPGYVARELVPNKLSRRERMIAKLKEMSSEYAILNPTEAQYMVEWADPDENISDEAIEMRGKDLKRAIEKIRGKEGK